MSNEIMRKYLPNIVLIPPILLILYALPYCFTFPSTRIPFPFIDNSTLATTICSISLFFIVAFINLRYAPFFWRMTTCASLSILAIIFFETIHILNLHAFRPNYSMEYDYLFLFKNATITLGVLMVLWLINIYAGTIQITSVTFLSFIGFVVMIVIQIGRNWYAHVVNDEYALICKTVGIWIWLSLVRRNK